LIFDQIPLDQQFQAPATQVSEAAFIAASDEGNALLGSQGCWMVLVVGLDRYTLED